MNRFSSFGGRRVSTIFVGCLALVVAWISGPTAVNARVVVELANVELDHQNENQIKIYFVRETMRQAVLMAARDLGAITRDESIFEPMAGGNGVMHLEADCFNARDDQGKEVARLELRSNSGKSKSVSARADKSFDTMYAPWAELADEPLREMLTELGVPVAPVRPFNRDAPVTEEIERLMRMMSPTAQVNALRRTHALIRESGESAARLEVLVRCYGHLGRMMEMSKYPEHVVFKVRSILYAERMLLRMPNDPRAMECHAYAMAMTTFNNDALANLAKARAMRAQEDVAGKEPSWDNLLDLYCHWRSEELLKVADNARDPEADVARFFALLTLDGCSRSTRAYEVGKPFLDKYPDNARVLVIIAQKAPLGISADLSHDALQFACVGVPRQLRAMHGVPPATKAYLEKVAYTPALGPQLREFWEQLAASAKDDVEEPSLAWLGWFMQERTFAAVQRGLHHLRTMLSVPADDFIDQTKVLYERNPLAALIEMSRSTFPRDREGYTDIFKQLHYKRLSALMDSTIRIFEKKSSLPFDAIEPSLRLTLYDCGFNAFDLRRRYSIVRTGGHNTQEEQVQTLLKILDADENHPGAVMLLMRENWAGVPEKMEEWERKFAHQPGVLRMLATRTKDPEKKVAMIKRAVAMDPKDRGPLYQLAYAYLGQKDEEKWLATLEEVMKLPNEGLGNASIQNRIARYFMAKGYWNKALPYAEQAAESGAAWAYSSAALCHQALGQWDEAEAYIRANAERYDESVRWYGWCLQYGHGEVKAARQMVEETMRPLIESRYTAGNAVQYGLVVYTDGNLKEALSLLAKAQSKYKYVEIGPAIDAALIADELGDTKQRDEILDLVISKGFTRGKNWGKYVKKIAELFRETLKQEKPVLDLKAAESVIGGAHYDAKPDICYMVGRFAETHGDLETAKKYYTRCITGRPIQEVNAHWRPLLAAMRLRALGVETDPLWNIKLAPDDEKDESEPVELDPANTLMDL